MKEGLIRVILGVGGFAAGFGTGYFIVKSKYDAKVMAQVEKDIQNVPSQDVVEQDEIDDVLSTSHKVSLPQNKPEYTQFYKEKSENYTIDDIETIFKNKKDEEIDEKEEEQSEEEEEEYEEDDTYPEFIEEEEMSKYPFEDIEELIYFEKDCYLTDLHYNVIENIGDTIGNGCFLQLDNLAKKSVSGAVYWVVNEKQETFYKIYIKLKSFASVKTSLEAEDDDE